MPQQPSCLPFFVLFATHTYIYVYIYLDLFNKDTNLCYYYISFLVSLLNCYSLFLRLITTFLLETSIKARNSFKFISYIYIYCIYINKLTGQHLLCVTLFSSGPNNKKHSVSYFKILHQLLSLVPNRYHDILFLSLRLRVIGLSRLRSLLSIGGTKRRKR